MQITAANLIGAQQAAKQATKSVGAAFAATMTEFEAGAPVKTAQAASAPVTAQAAPQAQASIRLGQYINIVV